MLIIGKGGHAKQCYEALPDYLQALTKFILTIELEEVSPKEFIIGFGSLENPKIRQMVFELLLSKNFKPFELIHPKSYVSPSAELGKGVQVHAGAIIQNDAVIGDNCIINTGAIVSHDCKLGKNVHITPGAVLGGWVEIGDNSIIGMSSVIYMKKKLPENTIVNCGSTIF